MQNQSLGLDALDPESTTFTCTRPQVASLKDQIWLMTRESSWVAADGETQDFLSAGTAPSFCW